MQGPFVLSVDIVDFNACMIENLCSDEKNEYSLQLLKQIIIQLAIHQSTSSNNTIRETFFCSSTIHFVALSLRQNDMNLWPFLLTLFFAIILRYSE